MVMAALEEQCEILNKVYQKLRLASAKTLYVIVHPETIGLGALNGDDRAQKLEERLENIMNSHDYLVISGAGRNLHPDMPRESEKLTVYVVGAFKEWCVAMQVYKLRTNGYNARFSDDCLELGTGEVYSPVDMDIFLPEMV